MLDWLPADARMREMGSPGARTRIETLVTLGRRPRVVRTHKLMDGINAGRKTILRAKFDEHRCAKGLEALRAFKAEWDEDARAYKRTPNHDWASHGADAWRYLSMAWDYPAKAPEPRPQGPQWPRTDSRGVFVITGDDLLALHERRGRDRLKV